jgi:hypothetical protein
MLAKQVLYHLSCAPSLLLCFIYFIYFDKVLDFCTVLPMASCIAGIMDVSHHVQLIC